MLTSRIESSLLTHGQLMKDQRGAAAAIRSMIEREAGRDVGKKMDRLVGSLEMSFDEERLNRTYLIDGARGAGKSSVLVHLLRLWSMPRPKEADDGKPPARNVIPVANLDMQPLPPGSKMLTLLVSSFARIVEALGGTSRPGEQRRPGALHEMRAAAVQLPSRQHWDSLLRATAIAWNGNLEARGARLDAETWAEELVENERQRISLRAMFTGFLDALVDDLDRSEVWARSGRSGKPFFVIGIDDADMNPDKCVEVLDLVRTFGHSRLAFVLSGDSELFLLTLKHHYLSSEPFGGRRAQSELVRIGRSLEVLSERERAESLAVEVLDKVVPTNQRFDLPPLRAEERMEGAHLDDKDSQDRPRRLSSTLARFRLPVVPPALPESTDGQASLASYLQSCAQMQEALPGRLRGLINFHQFLDTLEPDAKSEEAREASTMQVLEWLWEDALQNSSLPSARSLRSILSPSGSGLQVRETPVLWDNQSFDLLDFRTEIIRCRVRSLDRVVASLDEGTGDSRDLPRELGERLTAALMLITDVAIDHRRWRFLPGVESNHRFDLTFFSADIPSTEGTLRIPWPLPRFRGFVDYFLFSRIWSELAENWRKRPPQAHGAQGCTAAEYFAAAFLHTASAVALRSANKTVLFEPGKAIRADVWGALVDGIIQLLRQASELGSITRAQAIETWIREEVVLLAMPESGLPASVANTLYDLFRLRFGDSWGDIKALHEEARTRRIRHAMIRLSPRSSRDMDQGRLQRFLLSLDQEHEFKAALPPGSKENTRKARDSATAAEKTKRVTSPKKTTGG